MLRKTIRGFGKQKKNKDHLINISEIENDYYVEFNHDMTKDHFIGFVSYVEFDRVFMVRMYPELASAVRFPRIFKGKFYFYCNRHGLFEYGI